jgi:hypothetical protein
MRSIPKRRAAGWLDGVGSSTTKLYDEIDV